ncbi:MAG: hypothetical protein J2P54_19160 [Bradyrhizobiaceae bacterium]|nr:hypothetical protein [Bradyrhizobiaceae bacterium]
MDPIGRAVPRVGSTTTKSVSIAITAAFMAAANLTIWFPGESGPDGQSQYEQVVAGQLNDWHPPIMAWLWSIFRLLADGDAPMFCFQVLFYWLGFGLIAITLARAGRTLAAWTMLGVALLPPFLRLNVVLLKDVGMAVTFLSAFAALFWYRTRNRVVPAAVVAISLVLLFYGTLVRANAVFAVVPLFVYVIRPQWLARPWQLLAVSIPLALALVPAANLFNHRVLRAEPLEAIRSLQTFDITGIAFYSDDLAVFGPDNSFTREEVTGCYKPRGWDPLSPWGECRFFWNRLAVSRDLQGIIENLDGRSAMGAEPNPDLLDLWVAAIIRHPLAYATHRLANFSSEMTAPPYLDFNATMIAPPYRVLYDVVTAPALWLAIGAVLLLQLASARSLPRSASTDAALTLVLSSLPYSCAYLIIGVGTESRYLYWSLIAIFAALVIHAPVALGRVHQTSRLAASQ